MHTQIELVNTKLSHFEIQNLINMYYDRIGELEELECIENFERGKYSFASKEEANTIFSKLLS